jgi:Calx-beta domain
MPPTSAPSRRLLPGLLGLFVLGPARTAPAEVTLIDPSPGAGLYASVTVGSDGLGLIAYYDQLSADLRVAHCSNTACSEATLTTLDGPGDVGKGAWITTGSDGLGLIVYLDESQQRTKTAHCRDVACTAADVFAHGYAEVPPSRVVIGSDGLGLLFAFARTGPGGIAGYLGHCADLPCSSAAMSDPVAIPAGLALGPDGLGLATETTGFINTSVSVLHCPDVACTTPSETPLGPGVAGEIGVGSDGLGLFRYYVSAFPLQDHRIAHCSDTACASETTDPLLGRGGLTIGPDGLGLLSYDETGTLRLGHCDDPLCATQTVSLPIDNTTGPSVLHVGADGLALVAYQAADGLRVAHCSLTSCSYAGAVLVVGDAAVVEGSSGTTPGSLTLTLSPPSPDFVQVGWWVTGALGGTATPGVDYVEGTGSVVFAPYQASATLPLSVLGDSAVEPDETFSVWINYVGGAVTMNDRPEVSILDDDAAPLSSHELTHGSRERHDLAAGPGPVADVDYFRLAQPPLSSWEVVVDGASGGVAPLVLERLAADNTTVLQSGSPAGAGSTLSMRWENPVGHTTVNQHISVQSGGCGAGCGVEATYEIRIHETTGHIARFSNAASNATVVVLQNTTPAPVEGTLRFWSTPGVLIASSPFALAGNSLLAVNSKAIPGLTTAAGSITVTHDGTWGALAGKAVQMDPPFGFTFDTPLEYRPR